MLPGKRLLYDSVTTWKPSYKFSTMTDHFSSSFGDINTEETETLIGRYQGIRQAYRWYPDEYHSVFTMQSTFSISFKISLYSFLKDTTEGCAYVNSFATSSFMQTERIYSLYSFRWKLSNTDTERVFGYKVAINTCTCTAGSSISCTFNLQMHSSPSTILASSQFTLSRLV